MTTQHTHTSEAVSNIIANLEANHNGTRWQTEQGYNDSLRAIADARRIGNAHDELVAAVVALMAQARRVSGIGAESALTLGNAALAKARGEA